MYLTDFTQVSFLLSQGPLSGNKTFHKTHKSSSLVQGLHKLWRAGKGHTVCVYMRTILCVYMRTTLNVYMHVCSFFMIYNFTSAEA